MAAGAMQPIRFKGALSRGSHAAPLLPPLCRPCGWIALWRRIGNLSVLNRRLELFP